MASFLMAFGVGGVVARYYKLPHPAASGVVMSGIVYQFAKVPCSQQASSEVRMTGLVAGRRSASASRAAGGVGRTPVGAPPNGFAAASLATRGRTTSSKWKGTPVVCAADATASRRC